MNKFVASSFSVPFVLALLFSSAQSRPAAKFALASAVMINQAGYRPVSAKYVFATQAADSFYVKKAGDNAVVYADRLELWKSNDATTGLTIYRGDFSPFTQGGNYFISTSAGDTSYPFAIKQEVFDEVYRAALKGFYFQRCRLTLTVAFAGAYARQQCHLVDGVFHTTAGASGFNASTGGWHDAGDYGKYVVNAGVTVGTLLMAYEIFPAQFQDDDLTIPESGNGVPDILDETRYELDWLLTMQAASGGVYFKLTRQQFEGFVMPHQDTATRYIYQISSTATADFAAMMARASRLYTAFDTAYARKCLEAAEKAWSYLVANPSIVPAGGFRNPSGTVTGEYGDSDDRDERLWAAAELVITTSSSSYHNYYTANYQQAGLITGSFGWPNVRTLAHLAYLTGEQAAKNSSIVSQLRQSLQTYCQNLVSRRNGSGFHLTLQASDFFWGSNSEVLNRAIVLIVGAKETGNPAFADVALDQLNYILGANAHNLSFVTGIGSKSPLYPHHRPSASDGVAAPVPGLLAGGPNRNVNNDPVLQSHFNSSTPAALCYIDHLDSYASNEIAINWNAPLVFVAGYFNERQTTGIEERNSAAPERFGLNHFPNPAHTGATIKFDLPAQDNLTLHVFDILGRQVIKRPLGVHQAGTHQFFLNGTDDRGLLLPTGIYYYYVEGKQRSAIRKLAIVK